MNPVGTIPSLQSLLFALRSHFLWFHTAHHVASGPAFVGDHKLYLKIYEQSVAQADQLAEKLIPLQGPSCCSTHATSAAMAAILAKLPDPTTLSANALAAAALNVTLDLLRAIEQAHKSVAGRPGFLGLDNLLATFADEQTVWVYQLTQRTRGT